MRRLELEAEAGEAQAALAEARARRLGCEQQVDRLEAEAARARQEAQQAHGLALDAADGGSSVLLHAISRGVSRPRDLAALP